jgi:hypothetical protein
MKIRLFFNCVCNFPQESQHFTSLLFIYNTINWVFPSLLLCCCKKKKKKKKKHGQMQLEIGEWLLHLTDHSLLSRQTKVKVETGGRKWSRSLEEIRNTAYSLALQGVLWLLSYYTTNNHLPRNSTTISGLGPLQSLIKK